ncbi:MAG TPA: hypothetical protein VM307_11265, partial [Egibacteraceae bacterium]|nr:hypothetical protein [Egibacteraceae bacterium]
RLRKVPLQNAIREYTGSFDAEYASPALYQHVITADELELVLLFTGDEIVPGFNYETEIRGWIQLDGDTPAVDGPDEIRQPISFTAAAEDFTIRYRTSTATL